MALNNHLSLTAGWPCGLLIALVHGLGSALGWHLSGDVRHSFLVFAPDGLTAGLLALGGLHWWPVVTLAELLATATSEPVTEPLLWLIKAAAVTGEVVLAAAFLRRIGVEEAFASARTVCLTGAVIALAVPALATVTALPLLATLGQLEMAALPDKMLSQLAASAASLLAGVPLVLAWLGPQRQATPWRLLLVPVLASAGAIGLFFANPLGFYLRPTDSALCIPFLAWAAMWGGLRGASMAVLLFVAGAAVATHWREGPLVLTSIEQDLLHAHLSSALMAFLLLLLSALGRERERALSVLNQRERIMSAISNHTPASLFVKGADGRYLSVNPSMARRWQRPEDQIIGRTDFELLPPAVARRLQAQDHEVLQQHQPAEYEEEIPLPSGETRIYLALKVPLYDEHGRPWAICGVASDITERKRLERELLQARQAAETADLTKAEFLSVMSHELRTPLNAILGFSAMLAEDDGLASTRRGRSFAQRIHEAGERLLTLVSDILDLAALRSGTSSLSEETVELGRLVAASVDFLAAQASAAGLAFDTRLPARPLWLRCDGGRLKRALFKILSNAVTFSPDGGTIIISLGASDESGVVITIRDPGIGMSAETLARVSEPFVQGNSGSSRTHEGAGLGLSLARGDIALHGGRLDLHSAPGQGTTVTIFLPGTRVVRDAA